jgi:hypothetical protein
LADGHENEVRQAALRAAGVQAASAPISAKVAPKREAARIRGIRGIGHRQPTYG